MAVRRQKIKIVGCGPGAPEYMTPAVHEAVADADVLVGARRLLDLFPDATAEWIVVGADMNAVLEEIARRQDNRRIVVLVTGDPGIHSLAALVIRRFGREACEIVPGISSVQVAFARLGLSWQDVKIISVHAGVPEIVGADLAGCEKIAVLGSGDGIRRLSGPLETLPAGAHRIFACEDLTLPEERVSEIRPYDLGAHTWSPRTVIVIVRKELLA